MTLLRRSAAVAAAALLVAACSEPEDTVVEGSDTTVELGAACSADAPNLLDCARESTAADLIPDAPVAADGEPIVLGMINQENTAAGSFPELSLAAQVAIDWVNEELGGVDGRPIELEVCNTEFSAEGSTRCGQRFVDLGVPLVLGGIDVFGNGIDTLTQNDIPFVGGIPVSTQSATSPSSFQWSGGTWGATVAMAEYASTVLEVERAAIVYGEFGSITEGAQYGQAVFESHGVETQLVPFPILATDISGALQAAASSQPEALIVLVADTGCRPAFEGIAALGIDAVSFYTGACAAPNILDALDPAITEGAIFNVEGEIGSADNPDPDFSLYTAVIERYGNGLDAAGAGTVTFRSFMNLYSILRGLGADGIDSASVTDALQAQENTPSFAGHPYTCDGQQLAGLPALCSPQQVLAELRDGELVQVGDWIDVGAAYPG